jgi:hypothetical protein
MRRSRFTEEQILAILLALTRRTKSSTTRLSYHHWSNVGGWVKHHQREEMPPRPRAVRRGRGVTGLPRMGLGVPRMLPPCTVRPSLLWMTVAGFFR